MGVTPRFVTNRYFTAFFSFYSPPSSSRSVWSFGSGLASWENNKFTYSKRWLSNEERLETPKRKRCGCFSESSTKSCVSFSSSSFPLKRVFVFSDSETAVFTFLKALAYKNRVSFSSSSVSVYSIAGVVFFLFRFIIFGLPCKIQSSRFLGEWMDFRTQHQQRSFDLWNRRTWKMEHSISNGYVIFHVPSEFIFLHAQLEKYVREMKY